MAFRWKLFTAYVCLLIPALLVFYLWTESWLRGTYLEVVREELEREVTMLSALLDFDSESLDEQVDGAVKEAGRRLTVIAADGRVIADSDFSGPALHGLDNHATRPEVVEARRQGLGSSLRFSNSVQRQMLYVARRLPERDVSIRVSTRVEGIEQAAAELRRALAGHTLILILVGLPLAFLLSRHFSRPVRDLDESARRIAAGDFSRPFGATGSDEIGHLGRTLDSMAQQIQRQLRELESERNHLRAVLRSMEEGVMVTDQEGRITAANPALSKIFKLDSEPIGKSPLAVFRSVEVQSGIQGVLENGAALPCEVETNGQCLAAAFAPIRTGEEVRGVVTVFHDLSELRRLERARRDFVGNVSHELRTPLTSISGYSETLLQQGDLSDIQSRFLEKIHLNAVQLSDIVSDLLELSRLENTDLKLSYESVDMKTLERELRQDLEAPLAEKTRIELIFRSQPEEATFRAPEIHLKRILLNLLDNAFKYTQEGRLEVLLEQKGDDLKFSVSDSGMGIPEQDLDRVFERFYRGVQTRSEGLGGTGLGLSIAKHTVEVLGGKIWVESKLKEGTTVYFTIPRQGASNLE